MDSRVFDAMLKTALEEALQEDLKTAPPAPRPSRRHRARMRRLLSGVQPEALSSSGLGRLPARWLAALVAAALLTGTAAGYALGGGALLRRMFEESPWAKVYGGAADTGQLLHMGGELDITAAESGGLLFELLDAVSDGQFAMIYTRLTIQSQEILEQLESPNDLDFMQWGICPAGTDLEEGMLMHSGLSTCNWTGDAGLKEGQYLLIFSAKDLALSQGGQYKICLRDAVIGDRRNAALPGEWTLSVTLQPASVQLLEPRRACVLSGRDCVLERLSLSPLAMTMDFSTAEADGAFLDSRTFGKEVSVNLRDGGKVTQEDCVSCLMSGGGQISLTWEFQMPVDIGQVTGITAGGQEILLDGGQR